jgi:glycerophosphoryl diester phosphodiesterase
MDSSRQTSGAGTDGVAIVHDGRRVALKWHRLRRRKTDPLFGVDALVQGLRLGASMEIDLRVTGDGSFAVLHDATLDRETGGSGRVAERASEEVSRLHYDDLPSFRGRPNRRKVLLVDDLAHLLHDAHRDALLQFDMKDDLATVGECGLGRLGRLFEGRNLPVLVSGDCSELTRAIGERLPNLKQGLEPSFRLLDLYGAGSKGDVPAQLLRELRGPLRPDMVYLNWELILAARRDGMDLVAICHGEGAKVDAWTFTPSEPDNGFTDREWRDFLKLLALGVDQITTDESIATQRAFHARIGSG